MIKKYQVNEIFYSIQGEGAQAGMPAVFLRLAGCNLNCTEKFAGFDCDTKHDEFTTMTAEEIVEEVKGISRCCEVIITGGEPMVQLDAQLAYDLCCTHRVSLETNGTIEIDKELRKFLGWLTVSPKRHAPLLVQDDVDEARYVLPADTEPFPVIEHANNKVISPVWSDVMGTQVMDEESLRWCIDWVKRHSGYMLSTQYHKVWGIA